VAAIAAAGFAMFDQTAGLEPVHLANADLMLQVTWQY
jgi:hypothetical protein